MGYGRFDGIETAQVMARLYAAARLHVNFFQPSFKLKEKRREGAKVIKRYHAPATPYERALAHPKVPRTIKQRLRAQYRTLDPVVLLSEIRAAQEELGRRIDRRGLAAASHVQLPISNTADFAQTLGMWIEAGEPRGTHRRAKGKYKTRVRMPSKLDRHLATIEDWLAAEPQLTALAIVGRLAQRDAVSSDQSSIRSCSGLKALRRKAAERLIAATTTGAAEVRNSDAGGGIYRVGLRPSRRVGAMDCSTAPLTEPDMRARIRLFGSVDQRASESWSDACGGLSSSQRVFSETSRPVNQDGG